MKGRSREKERRHCAFLDPMAKYLEMYYKLLNCKYTFENGVNFTM